jgi:hypothetical protein
VVEDLLSSVPPEHMVGLAQIVLTNSGALTGQRKRSWTRRLGRKVRHVDAAGLYHQAWKGQPAWIELFVDQVAIGMPALLLRVRLLRSMVFGTVLFHEIGHHIHRVMRPEHREREHVADDWAMRLGRIHIRRRHPVARVILRPIVWTLRQMRRSRHRSAQYCV